MKKILLATFNSGKILEYKEIFKQFGLKIKLVSLKDLGISKKFNEDGKTFRENAVKKAKFYSAFSDLPILAEDSGLEIDYLEGEPGVRSRRWPGYEATDKELVALAMKKLQGVPLEKRGAGLRAVLALLFNGKIQTFEGSLRGVIVEKPLKKIVPGFPFRSIFYLPKLKKTLVELTMEEEAAIAHRKKIVKKSLLFLKNI